MKVEQWLGRIFLALISLVLTWLVLEWLSLHFLSSRAPIEQQFTVGAIRQPRPYTMFGGAANATFEGDGFTVQLNRLGYRGEAPPAEKAPGEYRVFMLGGSTVFLGEPPLPVLLEQEFARHGFEQVRVYNFGVISSVSGMEVARILFELAELEPDLIVMYNGGNDIIVPFRFDPRPGYPFNFIVYENNPLLESDLATYPTMTLLAYGSNLMRYFFPVYFLNKFANIEQVRDEVDWGSDEWQAEVAAAYVDNLARADKVSAAFGAEFIAFAQPLVYYKDNLAPEEEAQGYHGQRRPYALEMRDEIHHQLGQRLKTEPELKVIDLTDIYDDTPGWVFTDNIHTHQESKTVVAQAMYQAITQYIAVGQAAPPAEGP